MIDTLQLSGTELNERRNVLRMSDTHRVVGYALLVNVDVLGIVGTGSRFDCLVTRHESSRQ